MGERVTLALGADTRFTTIPCLKAARWAGPQLVLFLGLLLGISQEAVAAPILADVQAELDSNRLLWATQDITDYDYRFQRFCFCHPGFAAPGIVSVRDGFIVSVVGVSDGLPLDPINYLTLDGLFDEIQSAIDFPADGIYVAYDAAIGFPSLIEIDLILEAADDERYYTASEFHAVPEPSTVSVLSFGLVALAMRRWTR